MENMIFRAVMIQRQLLAISAIKTTVCKRHYG